MGRSTNWNMVIETEHVIIIQDLGPWDKHMTVTNGAQEVVSSLAPYLKRRQLFYIDSHGCLDEIVVKDGKFVGFRLTSSPAFRMPERGGHAA